MKRFVAVFAVLVVGLCTLAVAQNRSYTIDDLSRSVGLEIRKFRRTESRSFSRLATSISTRIES